MLPPSMMLRKMVVKKKNDDYDNPYAVIAEAWLGGKRDARKPASAQQHKTAV